MLPIFPSEGKFCDAETTLQSFQALLDSKAYQFAPEAAQSKVQAMQRLVGRIVDQREIDISSVSGNAVLAPLVAKLAMFCTTIATKLRFECFKSSHLMHLAQPRVWQAFPLNISRP